MEKKIKELKAKLINLINKCREVIDAADRDDRDLTAEDQQSIKAHQDEIKSLRGQIETLEQQLEFESLLEEEADNGLQDIATSAAGNGRGIVSPEERERQATLAFSAWVINQAELDDCPLRDAHMQAAEASGVNLNRGSLAYNCPIGIWEPNRLYGSSRIDDAFNALITQPLNAMGTGLDDAGGVMVPKSLSSALEIAMLQFGGLRQFATVIRTARGDEFSYPTADDTANTGRRTGENRNPGTDGTDPSLGGLRLGSYDYDSDFIRVANQLLRDSAFNLPAILGRMIGERIGRVTNTDYTTGNGNARPTGIVNQAATGVTTAVGTAIAADEILELIHAVDPAYRSSPGVAFMMHDQIWLQVQLLKDGNGQYLHTTGLADGPNGRIRGFPVGINQDMASTMATTNIVMLFGDLSKYLIRDVARLRIERVRERFVEFNQTAWIGFYSTDGGLLDAGTNPVQTMVMV